LGADRVQLVQLQAKLATAPGNPPRTTGIRKYSADWASHHALWAITAEFLDPRERCRLDGGGAANSVKNPINTLIRNRFPKFQQPKIEQHCNGHFGNTAVIRPKAMPTRFACIGRSTHAIRAPK
jgi:hypothetical protein